MEDLNIIIANIIQLNYKRKISKAEVRVKVLEKIKNHKENSAVRVKDQVQNMIINIKQAKN